jgi:hypothetical protein
MTSTRSGRRSGRTDANARSSARSSSRACGRNAWPSMVRWVPRAVRVRSRTPTAFSNAATRLDTACGVMSRSSAASANRPVSTTATKVRTASRSTLETLGTGPDNGRHTWVMRDAEEVIATLRALIAPPPPPPVEPFGIVFVGDGVVLCVTCRKPMWAEKPDRRGWTPRLSSTYRCACGTSAPTAAVDGELWELTRERLSAPSFVSRWLTDRTRRIDASIASAREIAAWFADPDHAQQADLLLRPPPSRVRRLLDTVNGVRPGPAHLPLLGALRSRVIELLDERARLSPRAGGRPVSDVRYLRLDLFWDQLDTKRWSAPGPSPQPRNDPALKDNWAHTPHTTIGQRRALLAMAVGEARVVVVKSTATGGGYVRVVQDGV